MNNFKVSNFNTASNFWKYVIYSKTGTEFDCYLKSSKGICSKGRGMRGLQSTLVFLRNSSCQKVGLCNRIYDTIVVFYLLIYLYWTGSYRLDQIFITSLGLYFLIPFLTTVFYTVINVFYDELQYESNYILYHPIF